MATASESVWLIRGNPRALPSCAKLTELFCNKEAFGADNTFDADNIGAQHNVRKWQHMGSAADVMTWLSEGYLAGDPVRYPLYVASMFIAMPFQLIGVLLGQPF